MIVLGDHSCPVGEHGNYKTERLFYNENFKTPLLIRWPEKIKPKVIEKPSSQIDILPTLLDILDIQTTYLSWGNSLLNENRSLVLLIQPYGGAYFSSVRSNFKYVYSKRTRRSFLFDLEADPNESLDIISNFQDKDLLNNFKGDIKKIFFNDYLIENNLAFPQEKNLIRLKDK